jgi:hypothetical protein
VVEKNNAILLVEINKFRLYYKIYEKLKVYAQDDKQLLTALGNNILKRVEFIAVVLLGNDFAKAKAKAEELGLKEAELYLREESNVGIKKYKSVIREYQKKYSGEIEMANGLQYSITELLKRFLGAGPLGKESSKEQETMVFWMLEAVGLRAEVRKEELDAIIEGKGMGSRD